MDYRTKIAAAWWTNALREKSEIAGGNRDCDGDNKSRSTPGESLTEQQLQAFEAALADEIGFMLTQDLTHVLAVKHHRAAPQFCSAAASCGIQGIEHMLPENTVMRIFPNTVMTHTGPQSKVDILWSSNKSLTCGNSNSDTAKDTVGA